MAEEPKFTLSLTGPQMDFIGKFTVDTLNAATTQARLASEVYQLLKAAVQPVRPAGNGLQMVPDQSLPEAKVDVSPYSTVP